MKRDVAVSDAHFFAVPEMVAVSEYRATLLRLICQRLAGDERRSRHLSGRTRLACPLSK
nr:hypothetical protein [Rhizobium sp. Root1203]